MAIDTINTRFDHNIPLTEVYKSGDIIKATVDGSALASKLGSSLSSAAWSVVSGVSATLAGSDALSTNVATENINISAVQTGCTLFKVQATISDGRKISKYFKVNVVDPEDRSNR